MDRRTFSRALVLAAPTFGGLFAATSARAMDPATFAAGAQLTSGVLSFMSRGSDPTVDLLISITNMLAALGKKIDAIDKKLDVLSDQIADVRELVTRLPKKTVQEHLLVEIREPWNSFLQANQQKTLFNSNASYLKELNTIYRRQREARTKFLDFSAGMHYDGLVNAALAYDAESSMVIEMSRVAASGGLSDHVEPALYRAALEDFIEYFEKAVLVTTTGGPAYVLGEVKKKVDAALTVEIELQERRQMSAWFERPAIKESLSSVLATKSFNTVCGKVGEFCLVPGRGKNGCAEPGAITFFQAKINVKAERIADSHLLPLDALQQPFQFSLTSNFVCEGGGSAEKAATAAMGKVNPYLEAINDLTFSYYSLLHVVQVGVYARDSAKSALKVFDSIYRI